MAAQAALVAPVALKHPQGALGLRFQAGHSQEPLDFTHGGSLSGWTRATGELSISLVVGGLAEDPIDRLSLGRRRAASGGLIQSLDVPGGDGRELIELVGKASDHRPPGDALPPQDSPHGRPVPMCAVRSVRLRPV